MTTTISLILLAYLSGSLSFAVLVCRHMGLPDPRLHGSGNPGATNVRRLGELVGKPDVGRRAAGVTLLLDALKGFLPVMLGHLVGLNDWALALVGVAAFLGHLYPVFFRFQGGKGVATSFGVLIGMAPLASLLCLGTWFVVYRGVQISAVAALVAAMSAPFWLWISDAPVSLLLALVAMVALLIYRHKDNIARLRQGLERPIHAAATAVDDDEVKPRQGVIIDAKANEPER